MTVRYPTTPSTQATIDAFAKADASTYDGSDADLAIESWKYYKAETAVYFSFFGEKCQLIRVSRLGDKVYKYDSSDGKVKNILIEAGSTIIVTNGYVVFSEEEVEKF